MDIKAFWKSKTIWVNVLAIGGVVLTDLSGLLGTEGTITLFAVVNIILRAVTSTNLVIKE